MNKIENKKGNSGWIVGYWNCSREDLSYPAIKSRISKGDKTIAAYTQHVTVMSRGKKQMTLSSKVNGQMTKHFHGPDRPIYKTLEAAERACHKLIDKFIERSIPYAKGRLISDARPYAQYEWWKNEVKERQAFIAALETNKIIRRIENR